MDKIHAMQLFVRVAELESFSRAAETLTLPKGSVSRQIQALENRLGTQLLHRTTRRVSLTQDGMVYYERAKDLLAKVGLAERAHHYPSELSGGQQQRVAIARSLAMNPEILLCDEITSALDPELVGEVLQVIESLAQEGMTIIMVTHEMNFARKVSDRVVFMHQGRVHEVGSPDTLFTQPQTVELRQFLA